MKSHNLTAPNCELGDPANHEEGTACLACEEPPRFDPHAVQRNTGQPFPSLDGRLWTRVVFGTEGVCAAETSAGDLRVWDEAALFDAVFRSAR